MDGSPINAVLTGDIIDSTALGGGRLALARRSLANAVQAFEVQYSGALLAAPEFFRGDSWQLALSRPELSLRLSLLLSARLRSELDVRTRVAIGIGSADGLTGLSSTSTGESFLLSGRALDAMTGYYTFAVDLPERAGATREWVRLCIGLCSRLTQTWTRRQAEIVAFALMTSPPNHAVIAASLTPKVAKQTVTKALDGAHWHWLLDAVKTFEAADWRALLRLGD